MAKAVKAVKPVRARRRVQSPDGQAHPADGRSARGNRARARRPRAQKAGGASETLQRAELVHELDEVIRRLQQLHPAYAPSALAPKGVLDLAGDVLKRLTPEGGSGILQKLGSVVGADFLDLDTWKGLWFMLHATAEYQGEALQRRLAGEYETDEWGLDREFLDAILPFFDFMYSKYWRVEMSGMENVPPEGRALLVSNHSGQLPWDGAMLATGMVRHHPNQRLLRALYATWFPTLPFVSDLLVKCGQVLGTEDNGTRLLENDELVAVFPEGYKGVGKLYKERYRLARFGRGGFVRMALRAHAPMIPVAVVGAEEAYISLHKSEMMAKLTGFPYFPISPTFPWLGLLGFVPLPTKWYIEIGEPIETDSYGPDAANNLVLVSRLTDQARGAVQKMINRRLARRRSVFF